MSDIETETEKWEGQVSDEWRLDTIYWLRATPNEVLWELVEKWRRLAAGNHGTTDNRQELERVADELEELIEDE